MHFIVIGTSHEFQTREPGLEGILEGFSNQTYIDPIKAIAEEYHDKIGCSAG
jgi:hypothetical protein